MNSLEYNGQVIDQRNCDGFVNATQMAKANDVRFADWLENVQAKKYLKALQESDFAKFGTNKDLIIVESVGFPAIKTQWIHPLIAIAFGQWISPEFHVWCNIHIKTLIETGKTELIENLERQFAPKRTFKEIDEFASLLGKRFGQAYEQRLVTQCVKKYYPDFPLIEPYPEEKASVSDGEALLTPTQIGEKLGVVYSTGRGDAVRINQLLQDIGFQEKIGSQWSATPKGKPYSDRKPVDTKSRTQKDQLLWKASVLEILQDYVANGNVLPIHWVFRTYKQED
jgi:hypothetical protein